MPQYGKMPEYTPEQKEQLLFGPTAAQRAQMDMLKLRREHGDELVEQNRPQMTIHDWIMQHLFGNNTFPK